MLLQSKSLSVWRHEDVLVLEMNNDDNRFSLDFIEELSRAVDFIEKQPATALVTTTKHPKVWSNGLVLQQAFKIGQAYFRAFDRLMLRFLTLKLPTVAAINGHAFAGGCVFAMAHDFRVMRSDLGFLCMNEVDMPAPLPPGLAVILKAKISNPLVLRKMILQGHRFPAKESLECGLVDAIAERDAVFEEAVKIAKHMIPKVTHKKWGGTVFSYLKQELYEEAVRVISHGSIGLVSEFANMEDDTKPTKAKL